MQFARNDYHGERQIEKDRKRMKESKKKGGRSESRQCGKDQWTMKMNQQNQEMECQ